MSVPISHYTLALMHILPHLMILWFWILASLFSWLHHLYTSFVQNSVPSSMPSQLPNTHVMLIPPSIFHYFPKLSFQSFQTSAGRIQATWWFIIDWWFSSSISFKESAFRTLHRWLGDTYWDLSVRYIKNKSMLFFLLGTYLLFFLTRDHLHL